MDAAEATIRPAPASSMTSSSSASSTVSPPLSLAAHLGWSPIDSSNKALLSQLIEIQEKPQILQQLRTVQSGQSTLPWPPDYLSAPGGWKGVVTDPPRQSVLASSMGRRFLPTHFQRMLWPRLSSIATGSTLTFSEHEVSQSKQYNLSLIVPPDTDLTLLEALDKTIFSPPSDSLYHQHPIHHLLF
mmetsp:Transcript_9382/g.11303  ORF Transcript_9382/g.11303 Transcript_9382/m.11303 type:complete len:186 (+) Transcript_9382:64-621(+)